MIHDGAVLFLGKRMIEVLEQGSGGYEGLGWDRAGVREGTRAVEAMHKQSSII